MFDQNKTFVVAELSQTHEGSLSLAKLLVKAASAAKADAVKVHVFKADELAVPSYKYYNLLKQLEWTSAQWKELIDYSHECGIKIFADVFGEETVAMLLENKIDGFKIHGTNMRDFKLLECLSKLEMPILLSCGGGTVAEAREALKILNSQKSVRPLVLMHGFQSYPTLVKDTHLQKMNYFKTELNLPIGYADHIDGDDDLNFALCAAAIGLGAVVIEKHITISRQLKMEDYESALSPDAFASFVAKIRKLDMSFGECSDTLSEVEIDYRKATRRQVVACKAVKKGEVFTQDNIALKRTNLNQEPLEFTKILGQVVSKDYESNTVINTKEKKPKLVATLACRAKSARLYAKPLQLLDIENEKTALEYLVECIQQQPIIDEVVLAISEGIENEPFKAIADKMGLRFIVGSEKDVQERLVMAADLAEANHIFRITTECPYAYLDTLEEVYKTHLENDASLTIIEGLPEGVYYEIIKLEDIKRSREECEDRHRSEFCSLHMYENSERYKVQILKNETAKLKRPDIRLTIDYPEDLVVMREIYKALKKEGEIIKIEDIVGFLDSHPKLKAVNGHIGLPEERQWF